MSRAINRLGWDTPPTVDTDELAKVSAADTTASYLNSKIVAGSGIAKAILNPGVNETLEISAPGSTTDEKVKASPADTTPGVLNAKLTPGSGMSGAILNPGANEILQLNCTVVNTDVLVKVSAADTTSDYLNNKITVGANLTKSITSPGANEKLNIALTAIPAILQPQWISAGAFEPLTTNTYTVPVPVQRTAGDDVAFTCLKFDDPSTDEWFYVTRPPKGWTSGKIKFTPHYIIIDDVGTPGTIIWTLGVEMMADLFNIDAMSFQTIDSTDNTLTDTEPFYAIGPTSAELTVSTAAAASGMCLRIKRTTGTESDPAYFVGMFLEFV